MGFTVEQLLEQAREFGRNNVAGWEDYERLKHVFHNLGYYGYEKEIADALNL